MSRFCDVRTEGGTTLDDICELLRKAREDHGMTIGQAAAHYGVHWAQWSRWESGYALIPLERALRISVAWRIPRLAHLRNRDVKAVADLDRLAA